jgi:hypothetical protein
MANALTAAVPLMAFRALEVLRQNSIMPKLVMNESAMLGAGYGESITINDLDPLSTRSVTPGVTFPTSGFNNLTASSKTIQLNNWEECAYPITDKEVYDVQAGIWPRALDEAVKALANKIDVDILTRMYQYSYETVGTAGTTPFQSSFEAAQQANRILTSATAPKDDRYFVVDEFASSNIIGLPELINVNRAGTDKIAMDGSVEGVKRVGFNWHEDQNILTHSTGATSGTYAIDANASTGATTIVIDNGAGAAVTNLPVVGDKFTIAGSTQKYTVVGVTENTPSANEDTLTIQPALDQNIADADLVTFENSDFVANVFFHKSAFGFASRPLADNELRNALSGSIPGRGETMAAQTLQDPVSGLVFRLEIISLYKQVAVSVDALYGFELIRPALAGVCFG